MYELQGKSRDCPTGPKIEQLVSMHCQSDWKLFLLLRYKLGHRGVSAQLLSWYVHALQSLMTLRVAASYHKIQKHF